MKATIDGMPEQMSGDASVVAAIDDVPRRWRLNRAGIVNVYQYENDVLHFGGGRLLLRGVNGSGKSTAMNMLLPFLLTARQIRIDAAGEQSRILKSWMLDGRDDAQPVGYLWIEFRRQDEFLVCGCGIRANRQSDTVTTWWFVTSKRPGLDMELVDAGVPLSPDGLRAALDGDEVYSHRHRADYRRQVELRLFNGASISQHIKLINIVRHPRVGDRIDAGLAKHLVDALPQLSEGALSDAAQPLEDLEEHRRSVAALKQTRDAVVGLLRVYRSYCAQDLRQRAEAARQRLKELSTNERDECSRRRAAESAQAGLKQLDTEMRELEGQIDRLRQEVAALEESKAYQNGQQLEPLRGLVEELARQAEDAQKRVKAAENRVGDDSKGVVGAQRRGRSDSRELNERLALARELSGRCRTASRPPGPVSVSELPIEEVGAGPHGELSAPGDLHGAQIRRELSSANSAVIRRREEIDKVENALRHLHEAERSSTQAEATLKHHVRLVEAAAGDLANRHKALAAAKREWMDAVRAWATEMQGHLLAAGIAGPKTAVLASETAHGLGDAAFDGLRTGLGMEAQALVDHRQEAISQIKARLSGEREVRAQAQARVDQLAGMTEPEPPRFDWQADTDHCLADLLDFVPSLNETERAGLEGALQASGLLAARIIGDGAVELANGELIALPGKRAQHPLSECLVATIPDRLAARLDETSVANLLLAISTNASDDAGSAVDTAGNFRLGALRGRYMKERAEFIGATARRTALDSARAEAAERLRQADDIVAGSRAELAGNRQSLTEAQELRDGLPDAAPIQSALAEARAAAEAHSREDAARKDAEDAMSEAERREREADNKLQRLASSLILPRDADGLEAVRTDLAELSISFEVCGAKLDALHRSLAEWRSAVERLRLARADLAAERSTLDESQAKHGAERTRLRMIEERIGAEYAAVVVERDRRKHTARKAESRLCAWRGKRDTAFKKHARAEAAAESAAEKRKQAGAACEGERGRLQAALETLGYLGAIRHKDDRPGEMEAADEPIIARSPGAEGLRELLSAIGELDHTHTVSVEVGTASADGVRQSLRQRRDSLGAGYDAEASQPDPARPLVVEVTGPQGRASLIESLRTVDAQHRQNAGLLNRKQADALRELLQGMVARELAEKLTGAKRLVDLMNQRLGAVATAHRVGVSLRWRRRTDLDPSVARMIDLLAKVPDLRSDDDERELRQSLSRWLDDARAEQPDAPYRQIIAEALDYKQWHDMSVMLNRGGRQAKLSRRTPLSEGEKKLVTYLPLFAAVAASSDALGEQRVVRDGRDPGIARFVLLDDAFAKVSEDNHGQLFGLLVKLDLDMIATSERLWGTHRSVPTLAITEVVRDAALGAILLEHYRWDGTTLERTADTA